MQLAVVSAIMSDKAPRSGKIIYVHAVGQSVHGTGQSKCVPLPRHSPDRRIWMSIVIVRCGEAGRVGSV